MSKQGNGKKWALGALIGAAAGYVTGLLTAPKSGSETREDIKGAAKKGAAEAEKDLKKLHAQLDTAVEEAKKATQKLSGQAKVQLDHATDVAKTAKGKAKEVLSAARDNSDTADADLKKAVSEADKALADLKAFLKK